MEKLYVYADFDWLAHPQLVGELTYESLRGFLPFSHPLAKHLHFIIFLIIHHYWQLFAKKTVGGIRFLFNFVVAFFQGNVIKMQQLIT